MKFGKTDWRGLQYIRNMHENYPEVTVGIETKDAIRSVLNHERATIEKMRGEGMLEVMRQPH